MHPSTMICLQMKWAAVSIFLLCALALALAENAENVNSRVERRANKGSKEICRYTKSPWTECDSNNTRSRILTLKRGDAAVCQQTKTIQKKCKKRGCRYEKAAWSQCKENGEMTRTDTLKPNSDSGCEPSRQITKKCNKNKASTKDKGTRRNRQ